MNEISNNIQEGYYSSDIKVKRPYITAEAPDVIPKTTVFSVKEADQKFNALNNDIYDGAKKEKSKKDFNKSLYFKIFGGVTVAAAGIAGFSKIKSFFKN